MKLLLSIIIVALLTSLILVQKFGENLNEMIKTYSAIEAERFGIYMINYSLDKDFLNSLDDDVFETTKNSNNEIQTIEFKTKKVNELLENSTKKIQQNLIKLENGEIEDFDLANTFRGLDFKRRKKGVVCEIPEGALLNNVLLSNTGPVIPIKLNFIGEVTSNIKTKVKSYGINNAYFEASMQIEIKERVTMPLRTEDVTIKTNIPIAMKIIHGTIPDYYNPPITGRSNQFSLPIS